MNNRTVFLVIYAENKPSVDYAQTWEENKNEVKLSKLINLCYSNHLVHGKLITCSIKIVFRCTTFVTK
jgi:hypothetical protein